MPTGRPVARRRARPLGPVLAAAGVVLAMAFAVALTVIGPKPPPAYRSPVGVTPVVGTAGGTAGDTPGGTAGGTAGGGSPGAAPDGVGSTTTASAGGPGPAAAPSGGSTDDEPSGRGSVAVVIGDGLAASPSPGRAFGCVAVQRRGWTCQGFAAAGSGYLTAGTRGRFLDQLRRAAELNDVGLVVVTGGTVDRGDPQQAGEAARRLVAETVFTFPGATVLLVPPFTLPSASSASRAASTAVRDALRGAADGGDVQFVEPGQWFRDVPVVIADDGRSLTEKAAAVAVKRLSSAVPVRS